MKSFPAPKEDRLLWICGGDPKASCVAASQAEFLWADPLRANVDRTEIRTTPRTSLRQCAAFIVVGGCS